MDWDRDHCSAIRHSSLLERPGVSEGLGLATRACFPEMLSSTSYISVRVESSKTRLAVWEQIQSVNVVPDTGWDVWRLWNAEALATAYKDAFLSRSIDFPQRSIVFHLNERYLFGLSVDEVSVELDEICQQLKGKAVLSALGRCHGDDKLANEIGTRLRNLAMVVDGLRSMCEIAACIAGSVAYAGSSMHGFITASAFGVRGICVARASVSKFAGLVDVQKYQSPVVEGWTEAKEALSPMTIDACRQMLDSMRANAKSGLDAHWAAIQRQFCTARASTDGSGARLSQPSAQDALAGYRSKALAAVALERVRHQQKKRLRLQRQDRDLRLQKAPLAERRAQIRGRGRELNKLSGAVDAREA
jgi:hypothetical protein